MTKAGTRTSGKLLSPHIHTSILLFFPQLSPSCPGSLQAKSPCQKTLAVLTVTFTINSLIHVRTAQHSQFVSVKPQRAHESAGTLLNAGLDLKVCRGAHTCACLTNLNTARRLLAHQPHGSSKVPVPCLPTGLHILP